MEKNEEMRLREENLALKERIRKLEEELRDCHAELAFAGECADIDFLTGIYNRKGITRLIEGFLDRESGGCGVLCFLDLDNFKHINDQYGHRYGDEVLCNVVQSICGSLGKDDVIGRFGGDEFIVYLRVPKSKEDIAGRAEAICRSIREEKRCHGLTASIGISRYPQDGLRFADLLEKADRALYRSKESGKDRICFFG